MRNLWEFLARYNHWFVFLLLEVISFILLFQYNSYQGSVWFSSANIVVGRVYELSSKVEAYLSLTKINKDLTLRNVQLEQQLQYLWQQTAKNKSDSALLAQGQLQALADYKLIPARVVSNTVDKMDNFITINKGSNDGIRKDMGVVCGNGIVGVVYMVSANYSVVIPVLNSHTRISCKIAGRGYFGYLQWTGGLSNEADVNGIPRHAHFKLYDNIVTNGYSSIFPAGVLIGKVIHVYNSTDGMSYRLRVKLSTDFGNLRDVCVIDNSAMQERMNILKSAQDSLIHKPN